MEKNSKLCVPLWKDIHGLFFGACPKNMPPYKSWDWRTSLIDAFARIIILPNCTKKLYTCWTHVSDMMAVPEGRCHQTFKFDKAWLIMRVANSGNAWPIDQTLAERQNTWHLGGRVFRIKINTFVVAGVGAPGHSKSHYHGTQSKIFRTIF